MPWLPLSHVSPAGDCILVGPEGRPQASNPKFPRCHGPADGWFFDVRDLHPWHTATEQPTRTGWIVLRRGDLHPCDPGIAFIAIEILDPADGPSRGSWSWAYLPPWPRSAHARIEALRAAGMTP